MGKIKEDKTEEVIWKFGHELMKEHKLPISMKYTYESIEKRGRFLPAPKELPDAENPTHVRPPYTDEGGYVFAGEHDASGLKHGRIIRFNPDRNGCIMMLRYKTGNLHGKSIMVWHDGRAKTSTWDTGKRVS
jgi:hypothetical protein